MQKGRDQQLEFCNCVCAINRQNYDPCQCGTPSLNISPVLLPVSQNFDYTLKNFEDLREKLLFIIRICFFFFLILTFSQCFGFGLTGCGSNPDPDQTKVFFMTKTKHRYLRYVFLSPTKEIQATGEASSPTENS